MGHGAFGVCSLSPSPHLSLSPLSSRIPHLLVEELESHYRMAADPIERTRYQIIWLLAKGFVTEEVVLVTGYHPDRIRRIARRYNLLGPQELIDRRRSHPGRTPMLSDIEQAHLWQALNS